MDLVYTIEAAPELYKAAQQRFAGAKNVRLLQGDSAVMIRAVLAELKQKALFWLDAHWCGQPTYGEVLSAIGDVAIGDDGKASLHMHIVLGLSDGSTRGGHLLEATVRPTLEVVLTETPLKLRRKKRADLGIALIDMDAAER